MRWLGIELGGATITPGDGYAGAVWRAGGDISKFSLDGAVAEACATARALIADGGRTDAGPWIAAAQVRLVEALAGIAAEIELLGARDVLDEASEASADVQNARSHAQSISFTTAGTEVLVTYGLTEARAIIAEHKCAVVAVAAALQERETLNAAEIDTAIAAALAAEDMRRERARRESWARVAAAAAGSHQLRETTGPAP